VADIENDSPDEGEKNREEVAERTKKKQEQEKAQLH